MVQEVHECDEGTEVEGPEYSCIGVKRGWVDRFEIELTKTEEQRKTALEHYKNMFWTFLVTALAMRVLADFGGLCAGLSSDCVNGVPAIWFVVIVVAVIIQLIQTERMTVLLSRFTHEDRPLFKLMTKPSGLDQHRVVAALGVLDLVGRFTRASFVGYALQCGERIDHILTESFSDGLFEPIRPVVRQLGMGGMAALFFIVGPVLISSFYLTVISRYLYEKLTKFDPAADGPMGYSLYMDDFAAMAMTARLQPISNVLDKCSVPKKLESTTDIIRMWEHIKSEALMLGAKILPDNIMQMQLQSRFLGITWPVLRIDHKLNILLLAFLPAALDTVVMGKKLVSRNRVISVIVGFILLFMPIGAYLRVFACMFCESSVLTLSTMSCLPPNLIHRGNITILVPPT
eukprot:TRINITY_DN7625_c0_g1_i2.p1 TRINITY_DN7625_c0_g1~~TRINITY_DN7625_c0_g1_i2.p1  ORF type:complete len:464 (+),score=51.39 TRINITY_DN7625_c0_g1_i2:187-1392(+)